jgi:hypothetical protein
MSLFEKVVNLLSGESQQKTPEQEKRDQLAEKALADARERGMGADVEIIASEGRADNPVMEKRSYTGQNSNREEGRQAA